jgi:hypothetical protein
LELDFFAKALRCVEATGKPTDGAFKPHRSTRLARQTKRSKHV